MKKQVKTEILINAMPQESRVAVIENGVLQELHIERPNLRGIVSNIYKGKVVRVLPGMQAAFVDVGLERAGFLHVSDIMPLTDDGEKSDASNPDADIRRWIYEGQEVVVQVVKDPIGSKGARLTTHLSVPARYLVYVPDLKHIGVSLRLADEAERKRLEKLLTKVLAHKDPKGYIIRTVAEGVTEEALRLDIAFLNKLWQLIKEKALNSPCPSIVHEDLPLIKRVMRDMVTADVEKIRIDLEDIYHDVCEFIDEFIPETRDKLEVYSGEKPIFEMYGVEQELKIALQRKVPLKSGGSLIIDQTEAMTTIDVNTGGFVGSRNLEETTFKTNMEAAQEIARQLRLRNLGGIIILDYIDMIDDAHREQVMSTFDIALESDSAKTKVIGLSELGLIQMTRKRTQESIEHQLCESCAHCDGRGKVKSVQTVSYEIFREVMREAKVYGYAEGFLVVAAADVVEYLMEEESGSLGELETTVGKPIKLQTEVGYMREQYDIILI